MGRVAFFDESVRVRNPGVYVLALVSVSARDAPHARRSLEAMLLPGQRRLHWRDESAERRSEILSLLEALGLHGSAYLALLTRGGRQSRARALCLEAALWDLRNARISEAVIESRGAQDRLDRSTILHAQKAGIADEGSPTASLGQQTTDALGRRCDRGGLLLTREPRVCDLRGHRHADRGAKARGRPLDMREPGLPSSGGDSRAYDFQRLSATGSFMLDARTPNVNPPLGATTSRRSGGGSPPSGRHARPSAGAWRTGSRTSRHPSDGLRTG